MKTEVERELERYKTRRSLSMIDYLAIGLNALAFVAFFWVGYFVGVNHTLDIVEQEVGKRRVIPTPPARSVGFKPMDFTATPYLVRT